MCETDLVFNLDVSGCATSCNGERLRDERLTRVRPGARFDVLSRGARVLILNEILFRIGEKEVRMAHVSFSLFWFISHLFVL